MAQANLEDLNYLADYDYIDSDYIAPIPFQGHHYKLMDLFGRALKHNGLQKFHMHVGYSVSQHVMLSSYNLATFPPGSGNPTVPADAEHASGLVDSGFIQAMLNSGFQEQRHKSNMGDGGGGSDDPDGGGDSDDDSEDDDDCNYDDLSDNEEGDEEGICQYIQQTKKKKREVLDQWRAMSLAMEAYITLLNNTKSYQKAYHVQIGNEYRLMSRALDAKKAGKSQHKVTYVFCLILVFLHLLVDHI
ncbi:MAG: hypothetical protein ACO3O8_04580 [Pelagibacteraceae bacterium]